MDYCWKCGSPMVKNSKERVCKNCGRTVQRHQNRTSANHEFLDDKRRKSLGEIFVAYMIYNDLLEQNRLRIKREKRNAWTKKNLKWIVLLAVLLFLIAAVLVVYHEIQMLIPMGYDSDYLKGLKYSETVQLLEESGFTNIHTKEIADLTISREDEEKIVTDVKLFHTDKFDCYTKYPSNLWITIVYHTVKLHKPPLTSKDGKGMNYQDVVTQFQDSGFTNIVLVAKYDIITGWLTADGTVKSIAINNDIKYDYYDKFRPDDEIIITYHTLRSEKPD